MPKRDIYGYILPADSTRRKGVGGSGDVTEDQLIMAVKMLNDMPNKYSLYNMINLIARAKKENITVDELFYVLMISSHL